MTFRPPGAFGLPPIALPLVLPLALAVVLGTGCGGGGSPAADTLGADAGRDSSVVFADGREGDARPDAPGPDDAGRPPDAGGDTAPACTSDGACVGQVPSGTCLVARCVEGACRAAPLPAQTACDDDDPCTGDGRCDGAGVCAPGPALPCDDADPCTEDRCTAADGCVHSRRGAGASCANPADPCDGSVCTAEGDCEWRARPDGAPCSGGDPCDESRCSGGLCVPRAAPDNKPCSDGNACTSGDRCVAGACLGTPKDCDDGDPCTTDTCQRDSGQCAHAPAANGTDCDDGDRCTTGEVCVAGTCQDGVPVVCDDGDPCTIDRCDGASGWCVQDAAPDGTPCDDGDRCTTVDTCRAGACQGTSPRVCDDGDPCTTDRCDPATGGCLTSPGADGVACAGSDPCQRWSCQAGLCTALGPKDCDDGNACTTDACTAATGVCTHTPVANGSGCNDGSLCTQVDRCQGGACVGTAPVDCDDGDPCTVDTCAPATGACSSVAGNDGAPCNDGQPCSADDRCGAGVCQGVWDDPFCCLTDADCAAFGPSAPAVCQDGHCSFALPPAPPAPDGCTEELCEVWTGTCRQVVLCGPLLLWSAEFEGATSGLFTWPPRAWSMTPDAAAGGRGGLRVATGAAPGVVTALGPWVVVPGGTAELRLSVRIGAEGAQAPDGTLTVRFGLAETTLSGPTEGFTTLALPIGLGAGRLELEWDGAAGVLDLDEVRVLHYGRNGCVRSRIATVPTHVGRAHGLTIARGEGNDVLVGWAEARTGTSGAVESEVSAVLLDPLTRRRSVRRLLSTWVERPVDLRLRGARANDGTFLLLYPASLADRTIEGSIVRDITQVPGRLRLPLDHAAAWAIDATALTPIRNDTFDGWSVLWSGPNLDGEYNSLRSQRWDTSGAALDAEPWRGGPAEWRDARHVEALVLPDESRLAAWVARRLAEPGEQAILARRVLTQVAPPPVSGGPLHVLATALPGESSLAHLRLAPIDDGFAVSVMRGQADGSGPWQLEVRRLDLAAGLLAPLEPAEQLAHSSILDSTPAPLVGLPDGGLVVVWRHRVATLEFVWYRRMTPAGAFEPPPAAPPAVLAGSALPFVARGAPDAVPYQRDWLLAAWPAGDATIEYRLLGTGCANGLVRCNGTTPEVCAGDRYLPFVDTCSGAGCGAALTCP